MYKVFLKLELNRLTQTRDVWLERKLIKPGMESSNNPQYPT